MDISLPSAGRRRGTLMVWGPAGRRRCACVRACVCAVCTWCTSTHITYQSTTGLDPCAHPLLPHARSMCALCSCAHKDVHHAAVHTRTCTPPAPPSTHPRRTPSQGALSGSAWPAPHSGSRTGQTGRRCQHHPGPHALSGPDVCVCVCVCVRARMCVRMCAHESHNLPYQLHSVLLRMRPGACPLRSRIMQPHLPAH